MMEGFEQQLLGAFRALELDAAPRPGGGITFCCTACDTGKLGVAEGVASCDVCSFGAEGEAWAIALAAKKAVKTEVNEGGLKRGIPLVRLSSILAYVPDETEEIWPGGILTKGLPTAIIGAPGVGKSRLALQAALATITGRKFLGWETRGQGLKFLFLQTENAMRRLKMDLAAMTQHFTKEHKAMIEEQLCISNIQEMDFATICMSEGHPDVKRITETLEDFPADVVMVDPLRDAGAGDLSKDDVMTATCQGIARTVRASNPRRAILAIHHGRTGSVEASKVFGDDAASFGRNSKVLNGWLRSQINVAAAGVEHPEVIIVGCGKCSDGPKWEPFAARMDSHTMTYTRLDEDEFDLEEWQESHGSGGRKKAAKKGVPTYGAPPVEKVVEALKTTPGQRMPGAVNDLAGLPEKLRKMTGCSREDALESIEAAKEAGMIEEESGQSTRLGGRKSKIYVLKPHQP